jgi:UDP-N-acetylglucosamine--N-acetylmuramyl-(pentapeptide) pyrophosphoryl-undecaprenol N-acetylglucosamine transferase
MVPAHALAAELRSRGHGVLLVTDDRGARFPGLFQGIPVHILPAGRLTKSPMGMIRGVRSLLAGRREARMLYKQGRPDAVVGFGGYPAVPALLAASGMGIPTVLHEQNAVLGRANRLLARRATRIATSFRATETLKPLDPANLTLTGNPVRPAIAALAEQPYPVPETGGPIALLVLGGSQGARMFGRVVPAAVALLSRDLRSRLRIAQQCRVEDLEATRAAYARLGLKVELATFFDDVPQRLAAAHLVIGRAGASTVAELAAAGRPAILIPYPSATDDHQTANAKAVSEAGGAWLMPERVLTPEALAERLQAVLGRPETLAQAAACARNAARRDATARLADLVLGLMNDGAGGGLRQNDTSGQEAAA